MCRSFIFGLLILCCGDLAAQSQEIIVPFVEDGKWGFMNVHKEVVVAPFYDEAFPPQNGLARVRTGDKYGFVNMAGELAIKPRYSAAEDFNRGLAKVERRGDSYYIKTDGKKNKHTIGFCGNHSCLAFPEISDKIEILEVDGKLGIVHDRSFRDDAGRLQHLPDTIAPRFDAIVPISHQLMYFMEGDSTSFADQGYFRGGADYILSKLDFRYEGIQLFPCRWCRRGHDNYIGFQENGLWGYKRVYHYPTDHIPAQYFSISSLANGFALVEFAPGQFGYIDEKGNEYFLRG